MRGYLSQNNWRSKKGKNSKITKRFFASFVLLASFASIFPTKGLRRDASKNQRGFATKSLLQSLFDFSCAGLTAQFFTGFGVGTGVGGGAGGALTNS
ncbi:MAG: hypothetical protein ABI977_05865 [Acidobacteriota bacterium]